MSGETVLVHAACTVLDFFKQTKRVQQVNYKRPKSGTLTGSHSVFFLLLAVYELVSTRVLSLVSLPAFIHGFPLILYALLYLQAFTHNFQDCLSSCVLYLTNTWSVQCSSFGSFQVCTLVFLVSTVQWRYLCYACFASQTLGLCSASPGLLPCLHACVLSLYNQCFFLVLTLV